MARKQFVVCIDNTGFAASLEVRKVYEAMTDPEADKTGQLRVIDESGSDYLYAASRFLKLTLSKSMEDALSNVA